MLRLISVSNLLGVALLTGCSSSGPAYPTGSVAGTVKYQGKLLAAGTVTFHGANGSAAAPISQDGAFVAPNAPVGATKVTVTTPPPTPPGTKDPMGGTTVSAIAIPAIYADKLKTPLSFDVREGSQRHQIEIGGK
jgi:hypothetical protein